jgi:hypothetical protein
MEISILGYKTTIEMVVLFMAVSFLLWTHWVSGCCRVSLKEGMMSILPADITYKMGEGVAGSWDTKPYEKGPDIEWRKQPHNTYKDTEVPLPEGSLHFLANNEFKPECCGSTFSSYGGCACLTKEQMDYINTRGGNRTKGDEF